MTTKLCPRCGGERFRLVDRVMSVCPTCSGTGTVKVSRLEDMWHALQAGFFGSLWLVANGARSVWRWIGRK